MFNKIDKCNFQNVMNWLSMKVIDLLTQGDSNKSFKSIKNAIGLIL